MDYRDLLDKPMQLQVEILRDIYAHTQGLSKRTLLSKYQLSQPTLKAYLSEIQGFCTKYYPDQLSLVEANGRLKLNKAPSLGLPNIIYTYLGIADAFKILEFLQRKGKFTYLELENTLAISSASIYRKIADLNSVLSEFNLSIQNGQIQGDEWQIRYFYYQLNMQLVPFEHLIGKMHNQQITRLLERFEAGMHISLSLAARTKFYTWLSISFARKQTDPDNQPPSDTALLQALAASPFYRQFHQVWTNIASEASIQQNDQDIAALYLASFCFGFLPEYSSQYLQWDDAPVNEQFPIVQTLRLISDFLLAHYQLAAVQLTDFQKVRYLLIQSILQYVMFQGFVYPYSDEQLESEIQQQASTDFVVVSTFFIAQIAPLWQGVSFSTDNPQYRNLTYRIQAAFRYTDFLTDRPLKVGLRFFTDLLIQELFLTLWTRKLNSDFSVQLEFFQQNTHYDLIITDYLLPTDDKDRCFLISEFDNENDIIEIKRILSGIYERRK